MSHTLTAPFPGSLFTKACNGCDPKEKCLKCKYLYENGGQCGGCHVLYLPEEDQAEYIEWLKSQDCAELRRETK